VTKSKPTDIPAWIVKRAVKESGLRPTELSRSAGIAREHMQRMLRGDVAGSVEAWTRLCEALDKPGLMAHILPAFTRDCIVCTSPFVDTIIRREGSRRYRMTCSVKCGATYSRRIKKAQNDRSAGRTLTMMRRKLEMYQEATVAFCKSCEPLGVCRNDGCELREVSPLPYIPMSSATRRAG
jgi:hypothetical protein